MISRRQFHGTNIYLQKKDYYGVLGVDRNIDSGELKKKFRELAKKFHPDANSKEDTTAKFQEIKHAYEVLSDPEKRKVYDQYGDEEAGNNFSDFSEGFGGFGGFSGFGGGGGGGRQQQEVGEDLHVQVRLTFQEAIMGCTKNVTVRANGTCGTCSGSGAKNGETAKFQTCQKCNGQGVVLTLVGGFIQMPQPCDACGGAGKKIRNKCGTCYGSGVEKNKTKDVNLDIPAGVDEGMSLRMSRSGHAGPRKGVPGDLIIEFRIARDPFFHRNGLNLLTSLDISLVQAILGAKVNSRTRDGSADVTIDPGAQHKDKIRLKGKGVADVNQPRIVGDQIITLHVNMPKSLTNKQKELLEAFEKEEAAK